MGKNEVEALLFSAGKNMNVESISKLVNRSNEEVIKELQELKKEYNERDSSLMIIEEGNEWKIHVREEYLPLVQKIVSDTELPKSVLETLAIIAYKSPILQSEVINARSASAYEHISLLADLGFVNKEKEGRSYRLRITEKFYEYFDVQGDKDMKEMFKNAKKPEHEVKTEKDRLGQELYDLKYHKPHGDIVKIDDTVKFTTSDTPSEHAKKPEVKDVKPEDDEKQKTLAEHGETDEAEGTKNVLDEVESQIKAIEEHRKRFSEKIDEEMKDDDSSVPEVQADNEVPAEEGHDKRED